MASKWTVSSGTDPPMAASGPSAHAAVPKGVVARQDSVRRMSNGGKKWLVYCQIGLTMLSCVLGGT